MHFHDFGSSNNGSLYDFTRQNSVPCGRYAEMVDGILAFSMCFMKVSTSGANLPRYTALLKSAHACCACDALALS